FEREREVVRNELREHDGDDRLRRQIHEEIYPAGHPYRRVDSSDTVATITYEDVCAFIVGPYRRGTVIVAISGAVDVQTVKAVVARQFTRVSAADAGVGAGRAARRAAAGHGSPARGRRRADVARDLASAADVDGGIPPARDRVGQGRR
ncbi:MAG: insulinase family protein, partial [Deltaproteobacteria bacterium]|nr:insulinase family protein [Deltaproteobacteria bacterium]